MIGNIKINKYICNQIIGMKHLSFYLMTFGLLALSCRGMAARLLVGDVDGDGQLTMVDVARLVDCIKTPKHYYGGVNYVDLGLPSGLLWATTNVGAEEPQVYGTRFAWGETETKDDYEWTTYRWGTSSTKLTRYCTSSSYGTVDGLSELLPEDDAASVVTGCAWHIPSYDDWDELGDNCVIWADSVSHIHGWSVMGKVKKTKIFLPNSGYREAELIYNEGYDAFYWASETYSFNCSTAYGYYLGPSYKGWGYRQRYLGNPVRPVIYPYQKVCDINADGEVNTSDVYALAQLVITQE